MYDVGLDYSNLVDREIIEKRKQLERKEQINSIKLCITLMFSGLRIGEALAITWGNVDFVNKTIKVERAITQVPKFDFRHKSNL